MSGIRKGYEVSGIREYGTEKSIAKKNSTGGGRCGQQLCTDQEYDWQRLHSVMGERWL